MSKFVAAIDQGTTSTRFIVFDAEGNIVAIDQKEHKQIYPAPGLVEHDGLEIWQNTLEVITNGMRKSGLSSEDIAAIGVTNQRETTILWNKLTGKPYTNAIVWQDTRTFAIINDLEKRGLAEEIRLKTGLPLATYFSGPKIKWILDSYPDIAADIERGEVLFGNMDTWVIWNLTGGTLGGIHVTDVTNASRTLLMDIKSLTWDEKMLKILSIPSSILPKIVPSSDVYGYTRAGLENVAVSGDLGDQQAALFGQACFKPGDVKNTYGTGCFMLMNTGTEPVVSKNGLLTTAGYKIGNSATVYCLEGSIAIAGALVQWLRDNMKIIENSADIEPLARTVSDNGDVYFVPAFSGLYAPYWRSDARGAIVGLTRFANRGHIARAVLESTAFQTREVLDAMESDSNVKFTNLKVDGGMVINELLMQFQADILNVPVIKPRITETTALGAAYAAGLAVGYWQNQEQLTANWGKDKEWVPDMSEEKRAQLYAKWKNAVTRTFDWVL
jgi:glycerol kinase